LFWGRTEISYCGGNGNDLVIHYTPGTTSPLSSCNGGPGTDNCACDIESSCEIDF